MKAGDSSSLSNHNKTVLVKQLRAYGADTSDGALCVGFMNHIFGGRDKNIKYGWQDGDSFQEGFFMHIGVPLSKDQLKKGNFFYQILKDNPEEFLAEKSKLNPRRRTPEMDTVYIVAQ